MLKGFVSGEEKDIKRIPMKGKNLFDGSGISTNVKYVSVDSIGQSLHFHGTALSSGGRSQAISSDIVIEAGTYRIKALGQQSIQLFLQNKGDSTKYYRFDDASRVITLETRTTFFISCGVIEGTQYDETISIMLNLGSTALPYEPYGYQEGWEVRDNQDRILWGREDELQTATATLPFKGYSLPLKVKSLLGNAVQNGTPAPDNIITPEMCGVRTANVMPFAAAQTITKNGITFESDGKGGYTAKGYSTGIASAVFQLSDTFTIPNSVGNGGNGTLSFWNTKVDSVVFGFMFNDTVIDEWSMLAVNRKHNSYTIIANQKCNAIRLYVTSSKSCDQKIQPEFTDNGEYPTEFEPYGWKVPFENHGENLFDVSTAVFGKYIDASGVEQTSMSGENNHSDYIPVKSGVQYTLAETKPSYSGIVSAIAWYTSSKVFIQRDSATLPNLPGRVSNTWTAPSNAAYAIINFYRYPSPYSGGEDDMLNEGTTPKPYSPYLNETLPVYLGEVPTVRRIKKVVFTGQETWTEVYPGEPEAQAQGIVMYATSLSEIGTDRNDFRCSHFFVGNYRGYLISGQGRINGTSTSAVPEGFNVNYNNGSGGLQNFKAWLASEYAAGHPVTLWYALATEQTSVVNEPLAKIGDYADELTTIQVHGLSAPLYGIGDYKDTLNLSTGVVTRKVKKLVLTGQEQWQFFSDALGAWQFYINSISLGGVAQSSCMSNIAPYGATATTRQRYDYGCYLVTAGSGVGFQTKGAKDTFTNITSWTSYLAQQYANGTPVTVWYVLDTPETETVTVPTGMTGEIEGYLTQISTPTPTNRSVPKWNGVEETGGTYAVTVYTPPEIPTTTGQNTLTVETNLAPSKLEVSVHAKKIHYGFKIDKSIDNSENAVIYTHDAVTMTPAHMDFTNDRFDYGSWGNAFFVRDCYPVALNLDGTIAYRLDPDDYTKKTDGTASDIFYELLSAAPSDWSTQWKQYYTKSGDEYVLNDQGSAPTFVTDTYYKLTYNSSFTGNFMTAFPKVWFYRHEDSQYNYIEISNYKLSDDWKCYAHINASGQEVDFIYLPLFKGVIKDSKLRSLPGQIPQGNTTATAEVDAATALGSRWQIWDHSSVELINDLLTLMSKSIDSQGRYGKGRELGYNSADTVTYGKLQTGTLIKSGKFHGFSSSYKEVKVFGIEGFWANRWDRLQGMLLVNNVWKIKMTPPYNFTGTDFVTLSNAEVPTGNGYLSKVQTSEYGSSTKYFKDYFYKTATDTRVAIRGGSCGDGGICGFRYVNVNNAASASNWHIGASPVYK